MPRAPITTTRIGNCGTRDASSSGRSLYHWTVIGRDASSPRRARRIVGRDGCGRRRGQPNSIVQAQTPHRPAWDGDTLCLSRGVDEHSNPVSSRPSFLGGGLVKKCRIRLRSPSLSVPLAPSTPPHPMTAGAGERHGVQLTMRGAVRRDTAPTQRLAQSRTRLGAIAPPFLEFPFSFLLLLGDAPFFFFGTTDRSSHRARSPMGSYPYILDTPAWPCLRRPLRAGF